MNIKEMLDEYVFQRMNMTYKKATKSLGCADKALNLEKKILSEFDKLKKENEELLGVLGSCIIQIEDDLNANSVDPYFAKLRLKNAEKVIKKHEKGD